MGSASIAKVVKEIIMLNGWLFEAMKGYQRESLRAATLVQQRNRSKAKPLNRRSRFQLSFRFPTLVHRRLPSVSDQ
jgi:hypothetical protein